MHKNISIIGAGIAGCSLAHFLAKTGWKVRLIESQNAIAQGGSGNPAAAIYPKFMVNDKTYNEFMLKSFTFTSRWINDLGLNQKDYALNGAIEILEKDYADKLAVKLSKNFSTKKNCFTKVDEVLLKKYTIQPKNKGLFFHQGGWVHPKALCEHLIDHPHIEVITKQAIISIEHKNADWIVKSSDYVEYKSHHVAICNAEHVHQFKSTQHLHTDAFRGQVNWVNQSTLTVPSIVTCEEGYLIPPMHKKHVFGATYAMNDFDKNLRLSDTKKNIASIKNIHNDFYQSCLKEKSIRGRVAWRASTKDRKPYVGRIFDEQRFNQLRVRELAHAENLPWLDNLYVASGFGSRGFTFAPYCAFVLANFLNHTLSKEDKATLNYTNPERYRLKNMSLKKVASRIFEV